MSIRRIIGICAAAAFLVGSGAYLAASRQAQYPNKVVTESGLVVEQIAVGQSCVVVVQRTVAGADALAVVPCRD